MSDERLTRRDLLKRAAAAGLAAYGLTELTGLSPLGEAGAAQAAPEPTIAVASDREPAQLVRAAVEALGGMDKFVRRGATVLVKPNIAWTRRPEQAATTNPEIVAEVVRLCRAAGARQVKVMEHSVDRPDAVLPEITGIGPAAQRAGATVTMASSPALYQRLRLPRGKAVTQVDVLREVMRADVFINVPIAKVHSATDLTLGLKNLMGVIWDRGAYHSSPSLDQAIADFAGQVKPHLVVLDAYRVLLSNGPKGPGRTKDLRTVVVGADPLAVDAYGAKLLGREPGRVNHLARAREMGVGELDLARIKIRNV